MPLSIPKSSLDQHIAVLGWENTTRRGRFKDWLVPLIQTFHLDANSLRLAAADASFRRYLRLSNKDGREYLIMDAPPDKEKVKEFINIAYLMRQAGMRVPDIYSAHLEDGFVLLEDLGRLTLLEWYQANTRYSPVPYFYQAIDQLLLWQESSQPEVLPEYDAELLLTELALFRDWYVHQWLQVELTHQQSLALEEVFKEIVRRVLCVPKVFVHRDFMPRNLLVCSQSAQLGILDFQDAVYGPITYDLASLLRDAFVTWDEIWVCQMVRYYWQKARQSPILKDYMPAKFTDFYEQVTWMSVQRHLKIIGIFCRLTLRDGKSKYLAELPRFLGYLQRIAGDIPELYPLFRLIKSLDTPT